MVLSTERITELRNEFKVSPDVELSPSNLTSLELKSILKQKCGATAVVEDTVDGYRIHIPKKNIMVISPERFLELAEQHSVMRNHNGNLIVLEGPFSDIIKLCDALTPSLSV